MANDSVARALAITALGNSGGEPEAYLKNASVDGNTLTLTKKDNTTVTFTNTDTTYTAGSNVSIVDNVISATDTTYTAGHGIDITNNIITADVPYAVTIPAHTESFSSFQHSDYWKNYNTNVNSLNEYIQTHEKATELTVTLNCTESGNPVTYTGTLPILSYSSQQSTVYCDGYIDLYRVMVSTSNNWGIATVYPSNETNNLNSITVVLASYIDYANTFNGQKINYDTNAFEVTNNKLALRNNSDLRRISINKNMIFGKNNYVSESQHDNNILLGEDNSINGSLDSGALIGCYNNVPSGSMVVGAVALGYNNKIGANATFASGYGCEATADSAQALGNNLIASGQHQLVCGHHNVADNSNEYAFIVGNGTSGSRSNALAVDWSGNLKCAGLTDGTTTKTMTQVLSGGSPAAYIKSASVSGSTLTLTKQDDSTVTFTDTDTTNYNSLTNQPSINNVTLTGNKSLSDLGVNVLEAGTGISVSNNALSVDTSVIATQSDLTTGLAGKQNTLTAGSGINISNNVISSTAQSYTFNNGLTESSGTVSWDLNDRITALGDRGIIIGKNNTHTGTGNRVCVMGSDNVTSINSNEFALVAGETNTVGGRSNVVLGDGNTITSIGSTYNFISGSSHNVSSSYSGTLGGYSNKVRHLYSAILGGSGCNSVGTYAVVSGKYNVKDTGGDGWSTPFASVIGNGTDGSHLSNAEATSWTGTKYLAGDVYVGCTDFTSWRGDLTTANCGGSKVATESYVGSHHDSTKQDTLTAGSGITINNNTISTVIPSAPTTDGTYVLQCVVSSGVATYSWVSGGSQLPNAEQGSF